MLMNSVDLEFGQSGGRVSLLHSDWEDWNGWGDINSVIVWARQPGMTQLETVPGTPTGGL